MKLNRAQIEGAVSSAYATTDGPISNEELYRAVATSIGTQLELFTETTAATKYNINARTARWAQQTLKRNGLLANVARGVWDLTETGKASLRRPKDRNRPIYLFSTDLGIGLVGYAQTALNGMDEQIALLCTSPEYPLRKPRAYGNCPETEYVDWLSSTLEPMIENLMPGGNLALVLGNDIFERGMPSRSLYIERLTLALAERFGLHLMDRLKWHNPSKAPGPAQWASKTRQQLNVAYEHILWFTNDPINCISDNRRVLQPHNAKHKALMANGGETREAIYSDRAYGIRKGKSFANTTAGKIPRNVLSYGHSCANQRAYKKAAQAAGYQAHGAPMPLSLSKFLVEFLSAEGDLVVDPFAGSFTIPLAAELTGRRWVGVDQFVEYAAGGALRFEDRPGFELSMIA